MVGKAHKSDLVVITDQATLLTRLKKIPPRLDDLTEMAIEKSLARGSPGIHQNRDRR